MPRAVVMGSLEQSLAAWASSAGGTLALAPHNIHVAQGGKEVKLFTLSFAVLNLCFEHACGSVVGSRQLHHTPERQHRSSHHKHDQGFRKFDITI